MHILKNFQLNILRNDVDTNYITSLPGTMKFIILLACITIILRTG